MRSPRTRQRRSAPLSPIGVPRSRPRRVSMIGVKGWFSANQRRPSGIVCVGTNPLPRNSRSMRNIGRLLAVSTLRVDMPSATESQETASAVSASIPAAATHATGPVVGRNPMSRRHSPRRRRWPGPSGCAAHDMAGRTEAREITIVRKRATMPSVMSMAVEIAVPLARADHGQHQVPGTIVAMYASRPPATPPRPARRALHRRRTRTAGARRSGCPR